MPVPGDRPIFLLFKRGLRRGWMTLRRERGWGMSLGALVGVVLLLQVFFVLCFAVQGIDTLLRDQTDLRLQVQLGATDQQVQEFLIAAKGLPSVAKVTYITREQTYESERKQNPDLVQFLEQYKIQNPFPDTIAVTLSSLSSYDDFSAFLKQDHWQHLIDPAFLSQATDQQHQIQQMLRLTSAGRSVAFLFLALTGGILLFITVELVRRRAYLREGEVFVERMSGAEEISVVLPFATEATILLFAAIALSSVFIIVLLWSLPLLVPALNDGTFAMLRTDIVGLLILYAPVVIIAEFLLAPAMGFAGAFWGTRSGRIGSRMA